MTLDKVISEEERHIKMNERDIKERFYSSSYIGQKHYCMESINRSRQLIEWLNELKQLRKQTRWIPVSERLSKVDEEACSNDVLISLRKTTWDTHKCQMVHITEIAYYDENAISSDGIYMDTEGWVLKDGSTLPMDEVIAWMPLPDCYQPEDVRQQIKDFADQLYDVENVKMMISLDDFKDITKKSIDSADTIKGILLNMCNGLYKKGIENAKE